MRNIMQGFAAYNPARPRRGSGHIVLLLALLLAVSGCQGKPKTPARSGAAVGEAAPAGATEAAAASRTTGSGSAPTAAQIAGATPVPGCAVVIDARAATAFADLAGRIVRGERVGDDAFTALVSGPGYAEYARTISGELFNASIMRNVMRYVYGGVGLPVSRGGAAPGKAGETRPPKRQDLVENFSFVRDHEDKVQAVLTSLRAGGACRILTLASGYIRPERIPSPLDVVIVEAGPDIRYRSGLLMVDAGLAGAAGEDQLVRLLAANLYRGLEPPRGGEPTAAMPGKPALAATFAKLQQEAVAAWLEGYPAVRFDGEHKLLNAPDPSRMQTPAIAGRALQRVDDMVKALVTDPSQLEKNGAVIDDLLRGSGAYPPTGYMMAALIAVRLGDQRWRAAATGSPADFLRAYQEAAHQRAGATPPAVLSNGVPPPSPADLAALRPFDDTKLMELITLLSAPRRS